jgi:hypothetical protein
MEIGPQALIGPGRELQRLVIWAGAQLQIHWEDKAMWRDECPPFTFALALLHSYKVYL